MQIELGSGKIDTRLAIIIDPPNQNPEIAFSRVDEFIQRGGKGVLIGGSGVIKLSIFQNTVAGIVGITKQYDSIPIWILPGHTDQIPVNGGV